MDDKGQMRLARKIMRDLLHIVNQTTMKVSFEDAYRASYQLVLHGGGALMSRMIKLIARISAARPHGDMHLLCMVLVRDMNMYFDKTYRISHNLPSIEEEFVAAREKRVAWAFDVFNRHNFKALWIEKYFQPGGFYEQRVAKKRCWEEWEKKRVREEEEKEEEEADGPSNKRAKRDNTDDAA